MSSEYYGMTDLELEFLTSAENINAGLSPWLYWTSELYSFGKCFREWGMYPKMLPLCVFSEHGAGLHSNMRLHEINNKSNVHFTWHPEKEKRYKNDKKYHVIRIPHPWVMYRKKHGILADSNRKGTLVFFTHHAPGLEWNNHDTEEYFDLLKSLPEKYKPIILCLHMHDIDVGNHKKLRRFGLPIVTAGNTSSIYFVDRFYNLVKHFSYATSQAWGSQTAYCVELGIPYFFLGDRPKLINKSHKGLPIGEVSYFDKIHEKYDNNAEELFRYPVDKVTPEQRDFVESILGLDSNIKRFQISFILWREFFRNWRQWHIVIKPVLKALYNYISNSIFRKFRGIKNKSNNEEKTLQ